MPAVPREFLRHTSPRSARSGRGGRVTACQSREIGLGAEGSKGVLAILKPTPGTIGYFELNYAKQNGVQVASIQN